MLIAVLERHDDVAHQALAFTEAVEDAGGELARIPVTLETE